MSTRSMVHFHNDYNGEVWAKVYKHYDGYPDSEAGMLAGFEEFFDAVEKDTKPGNDFPRFADAEYLAAKYIVWVADEMAESTRYLGWDSKNDKKKLAPKKKLAFTGVAPAMSDHGDIEYRYHVWTGEDDGAGRPRVTWEEVNHVNETDPDSELDKLRGEVSKLREIVRKNGLDAEDNGPGRYRVTFEPPVHGDFKDATEVVFNVRHRIHAENKAKKRGLTVLNIEKID